MFWPVLSASGVTGVDAPVATALAAVTDAMRHARDEWWIIGSAAVALHGARTEVADIDLLTSEHDAVTVIQQLDLRIENLPPHPLFRSATFARWHRPDRDVEIMAGFAVAGCRGWESVNPATRVMLGGVFGPDRQELLSILARFGRNKDSERLRLLAAVGERERRVEARRSRTSSVGEGADDRAAGATDRRALFDAAAGRRSDTGAAGRADTRALQRRTGRQADRGPDEQGGDGERLDLHSGCPLLGMGE